MHQLHTLFIVGSSPTATTNILTNNKIEVIIQGKRCKQLGRVMMNMLVIDITDIQNVKIGDIATIIGSDKKEMITAEEVAKWSQTNNYEVTTRLSAFLSRILSSN